MYIAGVRAGALGLMVNAVVLALMSLVVEPLRRSIGGAKRLRGVANVLLDVSLTLTLLITKVA